MSSSKLAAGLRHLRSKLALPCHSAESDEQLLHTFLVSRDESAFAILVRRHGPMVLHVCRRVLGHQQDAEDAFQATFLVLARNAASLRNKAALASFLHGTAYRTAMNAKQSAARRRKHEGSLGALTQPRSLADPSEELSWREVRTLLDEEIARLPEKYRSVFILCDLENVSREEASRRLGLKAGTVSSRLTEARKRLAKRLAKRGVELTAVLGAATLATQSVSALPPVLMASTIKAALATAAGEQLTSLVSVTVAELVKGATAAMMVSKAKIATVILLTASLLGGAGVWLSAKPQTVLPLSAELPAAKPDDKPKTVPPKPKTAKTVEIQGRVLDPDGKPARGAKLLFIYNSGNKYPHKIWAVSAADGRFRFTVPIKEVDNGYSENPWKDTYVLAAAEGYGFAATLLGKPGADNLTLRLVKDNVPIRGRILSLEGKPVAGARVRISDMLCVPKKGDLSAWLAALKAYNNGPGAADWPHLTDLYSPAFDLLFPSVTTKADGRFEIKGIGRERIADLRIEGPAMATQDIQVMTRPSEVIRFPLQREFPKGQFVVYHGAVVEILAAPTRPIVGLVRDKDRGKPLAGVTIESRIISE